MTTSLTRSREYLAGQRRGIIARAIAGSLAGALPIPMLDDWMAATVLGGGYRHIAAAHHIDLERDALRMMVHGRTEPTSLTGMAAGGLLVKLAGRAARRMMVALATIDRARSASRTFVTMTLFDHYCARLHTGSAIDVATAAALRNEINRAIDQTPGALAFHPFSRGAMSAARATLRTPLRLANVVSRGALRRRLAPTTEVTEAEAVDDLDRSLESALAAKSGFMARTVAAVELQLTAEANPYLEAALDALDLRWRAHLAAMAELVREPRAPDREPDRTPDRAPDREPDR